jgi:hypothetical protein
MIDVSARRLRIATIVGLLATTVSCSSGGGAPALNGGFSANSSATYSALLPGKEMTIDFYELQNTLHSPVRILSVAPIDGAGLGSVAAVRSLVLNTTPQSALAPLGGFFTYPPLVASHLHGRLVCQLQRLSPAAAVTIPAQGVIEVVELVQALRPGTYRQDGVNVRYQVGSKTETQDLDATITGSVAATAPEQAPNPALRQCVGRDNGRVRTLARF